MLPFLAHIQRSPTTGTMQTSWVDTFRSDCRSAGNAKSAADDATAFRPYARVARQRRGVTRDDAIRLIGKWRLQRRKTVHRRRPSEVVGRGESGCPTWNQYIRVGTVDALRHPRRRRRRDARHLATRRLRDFHGGFRLQRTKEAISTP